MLYWTEYVFFVQYSYYTGRNKEKQVYMVLQRTQHIDTMVK